MIAAAIYARVSHKDEGDDRTRSVARQVQDARAYATRKGYDLAQVDAVTEYGTNARGAPHATHALALAESVLPRGVRDVLGVEHLRRLLVAQTLGAHLEQPHDERRLGWVHLAAFGLRLTDVAVAQHAPTTHATIGDPTAACGNGASTSTAAFYRSMRLPTTASTSPLSSSTEICRS